VGRFAQTLLAIAGVAAVTRAEAASDPRLLWKSIETRHFRVNYYSTEEPVAERVATLAESIYERLAPAVGWQPTEKTELAVTDQTDAANGLASALPYNAIRLNVTAPDDMSPLGDYDDWYLELLTHEYTHILHTDHTQGIPALVNRVLGKVMAPNQVQPHWLLEGLAVYEESTRTSGGRLRSSMWNMFMRADVLENNVAPLDVFSNTPRRWPQGNIWYLYGSFFLRWIADTYGEDALRAMIDDQSYQPVPYGLNRSIRRATGRTFEELFPAWIASMRRDFEAQAASVQARGLREGIRLTDRGNTVSRPRWIPSNAWPELQGDLTAYIDDGHDVAGIWGVKLERNATGSITGARRGGRELLIRTSGVTGASFMPDATTVFGSNEIHNNLFLFDDLFELPPRTTSPGGNEGQRIRWTDGWRAVDPSVSPDGRQVVFTTNHRGTTTLMIADLAEPSARAAGRALDRVRPLLRSELFDQAFTPRWSPDGRHVAYSVWRRGGYRDVRIVDTADASFDEVTRDRAIDGSPVFSPDGRLLYFHSDRTGITNVYAYELATRRLRQVTNVIGGAFQPEPSPDGRSLAYVGYTHAGYDLFVMALDETTWLDALPSEETRPPPAYEPPAPAFAVHPYDPWQTLQPRAYSVNITPGSFGEESIVTATAGDIAGWHGFTAQITTEWARPELQGSLSYYYGRLPFDVGMSVFRQVAPAGGYALGNNVIPWVEEMVGASSSISFGLPRAFDGQSFNISYTFARYAGELPLPANLLNPYDIPTVPSRGMLGTMHFGWGYSNATGFLYSVGNEKGFSLGASLDLADPVLASDFSGFASRFDFISYHSMPWLEHHALALHAGAGISAGNRGVYGPYYVGGFVDEPIVNITNSTLIQGGITLRGYPVVAEAGNYFALLNSEYRFPIVNIDRGLSTLPLFLDRISGAFFVDYGSAFDDSTTAKFKTGVGGELWFDTTLGYFVSFTFRAGYAAGLASGGTDKAYFVASFPF
jgi:hypothetical protein